MTSGAAFLFRHVTNPGGGFTPQVGATCGTCHRTFWLTGQNQGWGPRLFKPKGWMVSSRPAKHKCPGCRSQRPPSNMTGAQKRAAYLRIEGIARSTSNKAVLRSGSSIDGHGVAKLAEVGRDGHDIVLPIEGPLILADPAVKQSVAEQLAALGHVTIEEEEEIMLALEEDPIPAPEPPAKSKRPFRAFAPVKPPKLPGTSQQAPVYTRGLSHLSVAHRAAQVYLKRVGVEDPKKGVHYRVFQEPEGWAWALIPQPTKEEPALTEQRADAPRQPTRQEIRKINDFLDIHYDVEKGRYKGAMTDAEASTRLAVPRAWVSQERDRAFGPAANEQESIAIDKWRQGLSIEAGKLAEKALDLAQAFEALKAKISAGPK